MRFSFLGSKYFIVAFSAFVQEVASTLYITTISDKSPGMVLMALIGPFLSLPFGGYMVESKTWRERLQLALALSSGYGAGAAVVFFFWVR
jgi:hypothetical protein